LVFERLFDGQFESDANRDRSRRQRDDKSVLDYVAEDARRLHARLGAGDQRKLDEYLTAVREIEQRIDRVQFNAQIGRTRYRRPVGIPADHREHLKPMSDLLALAFRADLTRIATFVFANDGSNRAYRGLGVPEGHHDLSHHGGSWEKMVKLQTINAFHVAQLVYLLGKLKAIKEGPDTLLDHCMIAYGSGINDGDRHNHDDLPILLAGPGGGTLKSGRYVCYARQTPLMNLYLSMLDRVGVHVDTFRDSTGRLIGLEG
jgi:hypothetical protein